MAQKLKVQAMALALHATLPSDAYSSIAEWAKRQSERFKDGGFTDGEINAMMAENLQKAKDRDAAKKRFASLIDARMRGVHPSGRELLMDILKMTGVFFNLRPGRNLMRTVTRLGNSNSRRVRMAYQQIHELMSASAHLEAVQAFFADEAQAARWGEHFGGLKWWSARPGDARAWFAASTFTRCPMTSLMFPVSQAILTAVTEEGLTQRLHPSMVDNARIRRDPITGTYVLAENVTWVTLESGELVWQRPNEASGRIFFDEAIEEWVRNNTQGAVAGYHSARRDWMRAPAASLRGCIGVELECGFKSTAHLAKFLNRFVDEGGRFVNNRPFLIERDSSLTGVPSGVEIISEPLQLYEGYQAEDSHWRWLLDRLVHNGAVGWKHRNVAGIHVNMDVRGRPASDISRFIALINNATSLSRFISGRKYIFGAPGASGLGQATDSELMNIDSFIGVDKDQSGGGYTKLSAIGADTFSQLQQRGKYTPVHVRSGGYVLEVRIFGANIRYEGFMACVEYCVAGMAFVTQLSSDVAALHPEIGSQFRRWLAGEAATYPNLVARLGTKAADDSVVAAARPLLELVA